MKRLLTYLFLVLGLGLVFSVNANAFTQEYLYLKCVQNNLKFLEKSFYSMGIPTDDGFEKKKLPSNFARVILKVDRDLIRFNKKIPQNERNTKITKLLSLLQKDLRTLEKGFYSLERKKAQKKLIDKPINETDCNKIAIAKKEPSQTQQVVKATQIILSCVKKIQSIERAHSIIIDDKNKKLIFDGKEAYKIIKWNKNFIEFRLSPLTKMEKRIRQSMVDMGSISADAPEPGINYLDRITWFYNNTSKCKPIKETTETQVVEIPQEQIKPIKISKDVEPPIIEIAEAITVDDSSYSLEGRVSDKGSDKIYIKVDGQDIPVKRGKFKIVRYSPVDEEVKIVAIDKWGNKSTKVVKVTIDIKEEMVVQKLEPLNPSRAKGKTSGEKVALIIGIENYTEAPKANYANLDAKYFFDYARKAFGAKKQNINLLVDEGATIVKTDKALSLWLKTKIKTNQSDLIIFFAGHGLASNDGKELYLLPQDGNPDRLQRTALSRTELFQEIINLNPKSVTMFLDTCYSGVSRDEKMLLASARPIRIVANEEESIPDNFTIFSASKLDQISSGLKEAKHGIFSYYLMKGLEGKADSNKDYKITNGELLAYMDLNVSQKAAELGRQQNPSLAGNPEQVLMSYR